MSLGLLLLLWRLQSDFLRGHGVVSAPVTTAAVHLRPTQTAARIVPPAPPAPTASPSPPPGAALAIAGGPSLSAALVDAILAAYHSPLRGQGRALTALSARYHIDDAVALAFFVMESRAGTQGEATITRSFGNLRPMPHQPAIDGYRAYSTWLEGASEWFRVMRTLYLDGLGLRTVEDVMPIYAPASDANDPATMVAGIHQLVACWQGNEAMCPNDPPAVPAAIRAAHAPGPPATAMPPQHPYVHAR